MKKRIGRVAIGVILGIMFVVILAMQYSLSYGIRKEPPSSEWSKEAFISNNADLNEITKPYPKLIKLGDRYITAFQDGKSIKVAVVDSVGKKINEKAFPIQDDYIKYINLLSDGRDVYLNWITIQTGSRYMSNIELDRELNEIKTWKVNNVQSDAQIDANIMITAFENKIEVKDIKTNQTIIKEAANPSLLAGTKTDKGYLITYQEGNRFFKYFFVNGGSVSEIKQAGIMMADSNGFFDKAVVACDDKYAYILVDVISGDDRFGSVRYLTFSFDGKVSEENDFRPAPFRQIYNTIAVSSGNEARFAAGAERVYAGKVTQYNLVEFSLKDKKLSSYSFATRTKEPSMFPGIYGDTMVFLSNTGEGTYDIYMTSQEQAFKNANNGPRQYEAKWSVSDTISGFLFSLFYTFTFGIRWIIPGLVLISGMSYFAYSFSSAVKRITYAAIYAITAIIKIWSIYSFFYVQNIQVMPKMFSNPLTGILIASAISAAGFAFGFRKYNKDLEALAFVSFSMAILIDSILTQMVFIPFVS